MLTAPQLLYCGGETVLPPQLLSDIRLDGILSPQALCFLQKPCGGDEILRRQELFGLVEDEKVLGRLKICLSNLLKLERSLMLWHSEKVPLNSYYLYSDVLSDYVNVCESLSAFEDCGQSLSEVSEYFLSDERRRFFSEIKTDLGRISELLGKINSGLLSFSSKNWITPDRGAVIESDKIASVAQKLGFTVPVRKKSDTKPDITFSDAVCRLYFAEIGEIGSIFRKYALVDFNEPTGYIPQIRFILEIYELTRKAEKIGVPHCIAEISPVPGYFAADVYDISLMAKECERIIPNDVDFTETNRFFFLTGANGGGKTTYLRAVGINLVLFLAGCPVFAKRASIYRFDFAASHFPKDERFDGVGRLDEELRRSFGMLSASENKTAFLLFNETFSGTDERRGFELVKNISENIRAAGHFCLYVTHFHEVINLDFPVLISEVCPEDGNRRTFKIVRSKSAVASYAYDIFRKYRLDKDSLTERRKNRENKSAQFKSDRHEVK